MTSRILLVHGWGFDPGFWEPVMARLPDFQVDCVNMGFRGPAHVPQSRRPLVVAHSMGFAWALANIPRPWAGVVAINAFARFTRAPDFVEGVAPRLIERMATRFQTEPVAVATEFLSRCGVESPVVADLDPLPLGQALEWLARCDRRAVMAGLDCPLLALSGTRDPIVPETMSRAAFASRELVLVEGAGHLLPQTHAEWVASQLRIFAARAY